MKIKNNYYQNISHYLNGKKEEFMEDQLVALANLRERYWDDASPLELSNAKRKYGRIIRTNDGEDPKTL